MNGRSGRLMMALGQVNGKYIMGGERNMGISRIIKIAVTLVVIGALGLFLFLPYSPVTSDISGYSSSAYFPLIEGIEEYRLSFLQPKYKNNFESICNGLAMLGGAFGGATDMAPEGNAPDMENSANGNGNYLESTDNQVEGVIESDIMKMTDKYIFRLGYSYAEHDDAGKPIYFYFIRVYSIDKENSKIINEYNISTFKELKFMLDSEMYLSLDGNTITLVTDLVTDYYVSNGKGKVGIISIDVSDVNNIKEKGRVTIDGSLNTSRIVDGKLLLVTEYFFNRDSVDYNDPTSFVPSIDSGNGAEPIEFEDIIFPDTVGNTRYSVVALMDSESLELLGANALLNFTENVYISENNVYITREYNERIDNEDGSYQTSNKSDIAVLDYSGERLEKKGIITARGFTEDQYSFDEKDGYLRVVTSTTDNIYERNGQSGSFRNIRNASLYIFSLADNSLAYKVEDFAPEGEQATAVRFDGDKCYVCTAIVVTFTDPVYFFDLSDYENITYTDTGIIEGYSEHLINYGDGFALGIGEKDWTYSKVDMYEERDGAVVSVDSLEFAGQYSTDYKSYLVNRDKMLFGFGVENYYENGDNQSGDKYILLHFNGYEFTVYKFDIRLDVDTVRAAYVDGYLYITTETELKVEKIN